MVAALAALLALTGCSQYSGEEQDYLQLIDDWGNWSLDSDTERQQALDFGYDVCDQLRSGINVHTLLSLNLGTGPGKFAKTDAVTSAHTYLCPELN